MRIPNFISIIFISLASINSYALDDAQIERDLKNLERTMSKNLPSGNSASMVMSVHAGPGREFTYSSVQSVPAAQWTNEMKAQSRRIAINDYCTNPGFQYFRVNNITTTWTFQDTEGRYVTSNSVNRSMCN